jgi:hypothetical protein
MEMEMEQKFLQMMERLMVRQDEMEARAEA